MAKHNPANERIKREYFAYLKGPRGRDAATIDGVAKSLARFEATTGARDFKKFRREQATSFGERLADDRNRRTGQPLSKATMHSTFRDLRAFSTGWRSSRASSGGSINATPNISTSATRTRPLPARCG